MLVTMVITLIVVALIPPILEAVSNSTSNADSITAGTGQARLAIESMEAQVESASQLCLPDTLSNGTSVTPGFSLLALSLAYGKSEWDQWTVTRPSGYAYPVLEEQQWPAPATTAYLTAATKASVPSEPLIPDTSAPTVTTEAATLVTTTSATLNGTVNPGGLATTYYFEYGTTTSYGTDIPITPGSAGSGSSAVAESANLTGLTPNTTYDFRIDASNKKGTPDGLNQTFTTTGPPTATTNAATAVAATTATLNGSVNPDGLASTYYFQYGTTTSYGSTTSSTSAGSGTSAVAESAPLTGLTANMTYDFRIVATNSAGTTDGANQSFTTLGPPIVATNAATGVTDTTATLNGSVTPDGLATTYYFQYGTTTSYGLTTSSTSAGSGTSAVAESATLTGLTPNTTYDFRIVATNSAGTTDGANQSFTTVADSPSVTTNAATGISTTAATLNGSVNPHGSATTYYFEYGTTTSYGSQVPATPPSVGSGQSALSESATLTGLTPNTTYDFQIVATNTAGTTYGGNLTFTTAGPPSATTNAASGVTDTVATLNGSVTPDGLATTYYFQYGTTTSYGTQVPATPASAGSGMSAIAESTSLTGLTPGTTYDFQIVATNTAGTSQGGNLTFTTAGPPSATTNAASGVTDTVATLNGSVTPDGLATTYYFQYGTTTSYGTQVPATPASAGSGMSAIAESTSLTGLTPGTTYDFQIVATNTAGTSQGGNVVFTTAGPPSATTSAATGISDTAATLNGLVNPNGLATTYYFQYGTTTSYGTQIPTTAATVGSGTNAVAESASPTGLTPNTTYDFRIVAVNSDGQVTGSNLTFTSAGLPGAASAATQPACVSATSATLNGTLNPNSLATTYYFQYGTTTSYGSQIPVTPAGAGSGSSTIGESLNLTGLTPNTTYDFQLVAVNSTGTTDGGNMAFTTLPTTTPSSTQVVATPIVNSTSTSPFPFTWWPGGSTTVDSLVSNGSPQSLAIDLLVGEGRNNSREVELRSTIAALGTPYTTASTSFSDFSED